MLMYCMEDFKIVKHKRKNRYKNRTQPAVDVQNVEKDIFILIR